MLLPARHHSLRSVAKILFITLLCCAGVASYAQNSDVDLSLHAKGHATAADIGLPNYPGASPYKEPNNDDAVDMGFNFGGSQFRLIAANYQTSDSPAQVLAF